eukprot:8070831-Pyramimonas_sp.AAC.1
MVSPPAVGPPASCDSRLSSHASRRARLAVAEAVGIRSGWVLPGVVSQVGCVVGNVLSVFSLPLLMRLATDFALFP